MNLIVFYTTVSEHQQCITISEALLEEKLIACSNIQKIESQYNWQEELVSDIEYALKMKTLPHLIEDCQKRIEELHPYDLPCICYTKVVSSEMYLEWVKSKVK